MCAAVVLLTHALAPAMVARNKGGVINSRRAPDFSRFRAPTYTPLPSRSCSCSVKGLLKSWWQRECVS